MERTRTWLSKRSSRPGSDSSRAAVHHGVRRQHRSRPGARWARLRVRLGPLNHASIIDGCRLRARTRSRPASLAVSVERACRDHGGAALVRGHRVVLQHGWRRPRPPVPPRHVRPTPCGSGRQRSPALGVFGPQGAGRCRKPASFQTTRRHPRQSGRRPGRVRGGSTGLRELLWNRARSFVFSTAPSPLLAELARFHVQRPCSPTSQRLVLHQRAAALRASLAEHNLQPVPAPSDPSCRVMIGDELALSASSRARRAGHPCPGNSTADGSRGYLSRPPDRQGELVRGRRPASWRQQSPAPRHEPKRSATRPASARHAIVVLGTGTGVGKTWVTQSTHRGAPTRAAHERSL